MEFCDKCGSVLMSKVKNSSCMRCGNIVKGKVDLTIKEPINEGRDVAVVKKNIETHPIVDNEECPECGHMKAYFWVLQTRGSDESPTKFFKCVKCSHTRRDYR